MHLRLLKSLLLPALVLAALISTSPCTGADEADRGRASESGQGLRAQLRPRTFTTLSSELSARIRKLDLHEGDDFKKGEVLVAFDCTVERARLRKARAELAVAQKALQANERLAELESISVMEVEKSRAEVMKAEADIAVMEAIVSKCAICAPFSGRVSMLHARRHQYVAAGQQLLDILDHRDLEVELLIPSSWLAWLKPGEGFRVRIDETGEEYPATVDRMGAAIDPVSQTVEVMGRIRDASGELVPGMSGVAFFNTP